MLFFSAKPRRLIAGVTSIALLLLVTPLSFAAGNTADPLEQQLLPPTPDLRLMPASSGTTGTPFPHETPCFLIKQVELSGQGINVLMSRLQNRLLDHGYVTTRLLAPLQNLSEGTLQLKILPGTVRNELAWAIPLQNQELYLDADYGHVSGNGSENLLSSHLAGGVIGPARHTL